MLLLIKQTMWIVESFFFNMYVIYVKWDVERRTCEASKMMIAWRKKLRTSMLSQRLVDTKIITEASIYGFNIRCLNNMLLWSAWCFRFFCSNVQHVGKLILKTGLSFLWWIFSFSECENCEFFEIRTNWRQVQKHEMALSPVNDSLTRLLKLLIKTPTNFFIASSKDLPKFVNFNNSNCNCCTILYL